MMVAGISGLVALVFISTITGHCDAVHYMLAVLWATIAICGAIRGMKK
jgi:hypothetical protein